MMKKCKETKFPLKEKDLEQIFSNLKEIIKLNSTFLEALEETFKDWQPCQTVGDVFCKFVCYLFTPKDSHHYKHRSFLTL